MAKKKKYSLKGKTTAYVVTIVITIAVMICLLSWMQTRGQADYQKNMSLIPLLDEVTEELDSHTESVESLTKRFHSANQTTVRLIELFMQSGAFKELQDAPDTISASKALKSVSSNTSLYTLMIIDSNGQMVLSDDSSLYLTAGEDFQYNVIKTDANPLGVFTSEQFKLLTSTENGWEGTYRLLENGEAEYKPIKAVVVDPDGNEYHGFYYTTPIMTEDGKPTGYHILAMADSAQMEADIAGLTSMAEVLDSLGVGKSGFVFSLDPETGNYTYYEDTEGLVLTGEDFRESGLTDDILQDGYSGLQKICGTAYFCVTKHYSSEVFGDRIVIAATIPESELFGSRLFNIFWSLLALIVVGSLILTYAIIIQVDQIKKGTVEEAHRALYTKKSGTTVYYNSALAKKILPLLIVGLLAIVGISVYTQTLSQVSSAVTISESRINEVGTTVAKNTRRAGTVAEFYNKQNLYKTLLLADIIQKAPEVVFNYDMTDTVHYEYAKNPDNSIVTDQYGNPVLTARYHENLLALCEAYDFASMYIFNDKGHVVATTQDAWNFVLSNDPQAQSYAFKEVLINSDYLIQKLQISDSGINEQYIGCAYYYYTYDDNGTTRFASELEYKNGILAEDGSVLVPSSEITRHRGLLQTTVAAHSIEDYTSLTDVVYTINGMNMFYNGHFVAFSADESHSILFSPFAENVEIPVNESMFNGSFNGFLTIDGERYFSCIRKAGDIFIGTLIPTSSLFLLRNRIANATVIIALIAFLNLLGFMIYSSSDEDKALKERIEEQKEEEKMNEILEGSANFDQRMPDGGKKRVKSAESRWSKRFTQWDKKSVEQKFSTIVSGCFSVIFTFVLLFVIFSEKLFPANPIVKYIISGNLARGFNIFVLTRCVMIIIIVLFGASIIRKIIGVMTSNLGARAETIGHLLESVIKYGGVILALFYTLYLVGLNTTSLLTSAGILSIVVGLGAQSLISDILAGVFIVFEGEFRVGDIVTIGTFRGTVIEIGIRTTKIEDFLGNIKIFNNSEITGVLNMTKEYSTVPIQLSIEYGESLERVESVLMKEFPAISKKLTTIVSGPFYKGVSSLGESSVNLLIIAQCLEGDRAQVERDLNRELYLAFVRNNINIPFPQVTVSYLKDEENKKTSLREKKEAEMFVKTQKEISAGVDTPEDKD